MTPFAMWVSGLTVVMLTLSAGTLQVAAAQCVGLACLINAGTFNKIFPNRNKIYTYSAFLKASTEFPNIGTQGSNTVQLRELAAFAAHVQQETAGLYYVREIGGPSGPSYCDKTSSFKCVSGQKYYGRGPLQLSWNYNYGTAASSVGANILKTPDLVATDGVISFKSALWFWSYSDGSIPSIHNAITGRWKPSAADIKANRLPGFGVTINIINGGLECGKTSQNANSRVTYYKNYCKLLGVSPGDNLTCNKMKPWS